MHRSHSNCSIVNSSRRLCDPVTGHQAVLYASHLSTSPTGIFANWYPCRLVSCLSRHSGSISCTFSLFADLFFPLQTRWAVKVKDWLITSTGNQYDCKISSSDFTFPKPHSKIFTLLVLSNHESYSQYRLLPHVVKEGIASMYLENFKKQIWQVLHGK